MTGSGRNVFFCHCLLYGYFIMHELSIVSNIYSIVEDVARQNNLVRVTRISLVIGKMRQVVPVAMEMAFKAVTKDTIVENALLEMKFLPIIMCCKACGFSSEIDDYVFICPQCESAQLDIIQGQELLISHIEGEDTSV